jgi:hypothetical protein
MPEDDFQQYPDDSDDEDASDEEAESDEEEDDAGVNRPGIS